MWGKLDDDILFYCGYCERKINPYGEANITGMGVEMALWWCKNNFPCPECNRKEWKYY